MQDLKDAVERIEPMPREGGDWEAVVRDARRRRPVLLGSVAGIALVAATLFALVLFQPWATERQTFLERALAAVDDGPVLHVVLRGQWGGTVVDLETGKRTPVHGENETWYDLERGLVHSISRLGDQVQHESLYEQAKASEFVALARDYRAALASGSARVAGADVIDGERVTWITIRSEMLPDSSDGKLHEFAQQVAVSRETYKPVATRDMRDRKPGSGNFARVLELATLPAGEGDFSVEKASVDGTLFNEHREQITLERAGDILGRKPLWLGREHSDLPLAFVSGRFVRSGRQDETPITGAAADDAEACAQAMRRPRPPSRLEIPACERMRARPHGWIKRGDKVYELGPVKWGEEQSAVALFYGTAGDDPKTYHEDFVPLEDRPHVTITESTWLPSPVRGGTYIPPEGSVFIAVAGINAMLRVGGLYVQIEASSEDLILSAARALKPLP